MSFTPFASGSGGNFYLVEDGGARLAIEAGVRFSQIQKFLQFRTSDLCGVLVTHAHGDHSAAVPDLLKRAVTVAMSRETASALKCSAHHRVQLLEDRKADQVGRFRVLPFATVHDCPGALGFVVEGPSGDRLAFLTDTAYSPVRFEGINIFAVECNWSEDLMRGNHLSGAVHSSRFKRTVRTHMSLERLLDLMKANDISKVREIHLLHLSNENSDEEAFVKAVMRETGVPTYAAQS